MLLHYYNVSAIILQVFLHCAQNLILHIYCVVILLQHYVSIFKKRTFLRCCNVAEILQQYFAIFLQCCNLAMKYSCNVVAIFLCCMGCVHIWVSYFLFFSLWIPRVDVVQRTSALS